jgi:hypothetical protein
MYHCHTTRAAVSILLAASCMAQCEEPSAGQQYIQTPCSAEMATQLAECAADVPKNSYVKRACIPGTNGLEGADGWVAGAAGSDTEIVACLGTVAAGWYVEQACSRGGPQRKGSDTKIAKCSSPGASQWVSAACEAGDVGSKGSDTAFQPCGSSAEVEGRSRSLVAFDVEGNCTSRSCVQDECCAVPQLCADSPFNSDSSCRAAPGNTSLTLFDEGGYCDGETCLREVIFPAGRFLGEITTPRRPGESLHSAVLSRDFQAKNFFTDQHSPTIKIRAPAPEVSSGNNHSFNVWILLTLNVRRNAANHLNYAHNRLTVATRTVVPSVQKIALQICAGNTKTGRRSDWRVAM